MYVCVLSMIMTTPQAFIQPSWVNIHGCSSYSSMAAGHETILLRDGVTVVGDKHNFVHSVHSFRFVVYLIAYDELFSHSCFPR